LADTALGEALASAEQYLLDLAVSLGYVADAAPLEPSPTSTPE
jgi:hypothetical protein